MKQVLANYLRRRVGLQILALLAVLTALMQLLELLDITTDILDRNLGLAGIAHYALLRLPGELMLSLPLATLLGAMSAFYALARTREITALRCAGLSLKGLLRRLWPVPLALALLQLALSQTLVPHSEAALKTWWDSTAPADTELKPSWAHTSTGPVSFQRASIDGRQLRKLRIYQRDDGGLLSMRITADSAQWTGHGWQLQNVEELRVGDTRLQTTQFARRDWQTNLRPEDVVRLEVVQPHLSGMMLVDVIVGERVGSQPLSYYRTVLLRSFTAPLGIFIMLLLAIPPATHLARGGGGGAGLMIALTLGLSFLLCDGILSALGSSGRIPAWLAALAAPLLFMVIGLAQLQAYDRK